MFKKHAQHIALSAIILILLILICHFSNATDTNYLSWLENFTTVTTKPSPTYCPGSHPKIPCNMVKTCPNPTNKLSSENIEIIDRYIYLKSLLESTKILNGNEDKWELL